MSNTVIAFLVAISAGVWIYNKLMKNTGGNTQNSAIAAGVSGIGIFILLVVVLGMIF